MPATPNQQLHIAICDDESIDRQQAANMAREIIAAEGLSCDLSSYESATALLTAIQGGAQFHILLLDVMMDGMDGMELATALRELGNNTAIVFISSNREMALRGYEVAAVRYLAKPLQTSQLREALLYCHKTIREKKELLLPTEKGQSRISPTDIVYAEPWGRGSRLHLSSSGILETSLKFSDLVALLPRHSFTLSHRTALINLAFVRHLRSGEIELAGGKTLPVSKYRVQELRQRLMEYLGD